MIDTDFNRKNNFLILFARDEIIYSNAKIRQ